MHGMADPPDELMIEMNAVMDAARAAVRGGDLDHVFSAGSRVGLMIGIGLATAHAIREQGLRDSRRAAGQGELYKRHDARAQAFEELANALRQWDARHAA
jgi:hypothetical protein